MSLTDLLQGFRKDPQFMANVMAWRTLPARAGRFAAIPPDLHPALHRALARRGIEQLYLHQAQAVGLALQGKDFAVVTPTASGKTLCYTLPVLHTLLSDPSARALYLFPTKALAHDQLDETRTWVSALGQTDTTLPLPVSTYDGDTPSAQRVAIRRNARLILSNPDMLHSGILPYHTAWADFFAGLRYVVIDEMHTYRGVFGSHVANVLRRLQRICAFYGSRPHFIATSATIANPQQLAERLVERPVTVINENGAPQGEKHLILYNPSVYDAERGLRRSSVLEAQELAVRCILGGLQTIVFARARLTTEVLLTYLRERMAQVRDTECQQHLPRDSALWGARWAPPSAFRGYRGGYLPHERRAIEGGLRSGEVRAVVTTNALELGIDIGQLQAAILCGYPGNIASTWQQMGRAGRTLDAALAILVATGGALDQYVILHPEFLFERSPEQALINPDNLMILVEHLRCAVFEAPFEEGETFGASLFTADVLHLLVEEGAVQQHGGRFHWSGEGYPARRISLRTATSDTVAIQVQRNENGVGASRGPNVVAAQPEIIGVIDHASAPLLLHDGAIYLHEGQSYRVDQLDLAQNLAHVRPVVVDYYTEAATETQIDILAEHEQRQADLARVAHGDLQVQTQVIGFRRVKRFTHENLGVQPLDYPPQVTETSGYWFSVLPEAQRQLEHTGQWFDSANDYGPNWQEQRTRVRARDGYRCTLCGAPEPAGRQHDVHHRAPFRTFGYVPGLNENYLLANELENLVLLCRNCHQRMEATVRVRTGLDGVAYALGNLAPLHLMCDAQDIGVSVVRPDRTVKAEVSEQSEMNQSSSSVTQRLPTIFIYERAVAGLGFCARLYELHDQLLRAARELIVSCPCRDGCPACVGPVLEDSAVFLPTKRLAHALLDALGRRPHLQQPVTNEVDFMR